MRPRLLTEDSNFFPVLTVYIDVQVSQVFHQFLAMQIAEGGEVDAFFGKLLANLGRNHAEQFHARAQKGQRDANIHLAPSSTWGQAVLAVGRTPFGPTRSQRSSKEITQIPPLWKTLLPWDTL
jgi:hypothetical protein